MSPDWCCTNVTAANTNHPPIVIGVGRVGSYSAAKQGFYSRRRRYWAISKWNDACAPHCRCKGTGVHHYPMGHVEDPAHPHFTTKTQADQYLGTLMTANQPIKVDDRFLYRFHDYQESGNEVNKAHDGQPCTVVRLHTPQAGGAEVQATYGIRFDDQQMAMATAEELQPLTEYGTPLTVIVLNAQAIIDHAKIVGWIEDFTQMGVTRLTRSHTTLIVSIFDSMALVIFHAGSHKQTHTVDMTNREVVSQFLKQDPEMWAQ